VATPANESSFVISARRLRHSMQTAVRHYIDLRTGRGQTAAQEAWETPLVKVKDSST